MHFCISKWASDNFEYGMIFFFCLPYFKEVNALRMLELWDFCVVKMIVLDHL